jgi:hypothetical protein
MRGRHTQRSQARSTPAEPSSPGGRQVSAAPAPKKAAVVVLGMHRSGTSALTRVLNLLGCDLPRTLMGAGTGNEAGHWESQAICDLNDRILESAGSAWHDWQVFNPNWLKSPRADEFYDEALAVLASEFGKSRLFVLKDPRICRLAEFWFKVLEAFDAAPLVVLPIRNPLEVAASLAKRDGFDPSIGQLLWLRHALEAERATRGWPRVFVSYDGLMSGWRGTVDRLQAALGLSLPRAADASAGAIEAFLSEQLRHERTAPASVTDNPGLSRWLRDSFAILDRWARNDEKPDDAAALDGIATALDAAAPAFARPVEIGRQAVASQRRLEQELVAARSDLAGRDTRIAGLEREAGATGKDLAETLARLAQTESALAQRRHEADERAEELAAARQDLRRLTEARAETDTLLAGYKDHVVLLLANERERQTALAALEAEIGRQKEQNAADVERLQAEMQRRVAEKEYALEALRREAAALRSALEEAQHRDAQSAGKLDELAAGNDDLSRKNAQAATELAKLTSEKRALEGRLGERFDEIAALTGMVRDGEGRIDTLRRSVAALVAADRAPALQMLGPGTRWWDRLQERRKAAALMRAGLFDPAWYLENNPDVKKAGMDPARHYLRHGIHEGRAPCAPAASR